MPVTFDGEAIKGLFFLVTDDPTATTPELSVPTPRTRDCCADFRLNVYADAAGTDPFKNDLNGFLWAFNDVVTTSTIVLQTWDEATHDWVDLVTIAGNTLGTFYPFGFYTNEAGQKYVGFQIDWRAVMLAHGEGSYRLKNTIATALGGAAVFTTNEFCLMQFTPERVNGTVKIEYRLNYLIGDNTNDRAQRDFANLNWYNAVRLPAWFGNNVATYEREFIQYQNGQRLWVKDEQTPEFVLKTRPLPVFLLDLLRTDVMQADEVLITDYNANNPNAHIQRAVVANSDWAPNWQRGTRLASIELKFTPAFNNFKRRRC